MGPARALGHRADIPSPSCVAPFFARRGGAVRDGAAGEPLFSRPYQIENGGWAGRWAIGAVAARTAGVTGVFAFLALLVECVTWEHDLTIAHAAAVQHGARDHCPKTAVVLVI